MAQERCSSRLLVVALALLFIAVACTSQMGPTTTVKVDVFGALSGEASDSVTPGVQAAQLAIDQANADGRFR